VFFYRSRGGSYFHRRIASESQSPLLPSSYGNSTEKISASSGFSMLSSSSSNNDSFMANNYSSYRPKGHVSTNPFSTSYYDPYQRYHHNYAPAHEHQSTLAPQATNKYHPHHHRLSMPTSPVHEHPSYNQYRHHGNYGLPSEPRAVRSSSGSQIHENEDQSHIYDYHAAQLSAFLEEYRVLQTELMRMRASLNNVEQPSGNYGNQPSTSSQSGAAATSPPGTNVNGNSKCAKNDTTSKNDNDKVVDGENNSGSGAPLLDSNELDTKIVSNNENVCPIDLEDESNRDQPQLKSILKNTSPTSSNHVQNNNYSIV